jgi:hypothetical protein
MLAARDGACASCGTVESIRAVEIKVMQAAWVQSQAA